jgi:hypothetical protein
MWEMDATDWRDPITHANDRIGAIRACNPLTALGYVANGAGRC